MGPPALFPIRRKVCRGFCSPLKIHRLSQKPWPLGPVASGHYTTEATIVCFTVSEQRKARETATRTGNTTGSAVWRGAAAVFSPENTPCLPAHSMTAIPFLLRYVQTRLAAQNDVGTATIMQHVRSSSQGTYQLLVGCIMVTVSRVAQSVRAGRPGDRRSIPRQMRKDFSSSLCVQTGSVAHPASCPMGNGGPFPGSKAWPRRDADHSPHLVPRSRMNRSYISSSPKRLHGV
jgi:hypothetical protein